MQATPYIWMDGKLVEWEKATVHVLAHVVHYGSSVFEGIRCYATPHGSAVFRLTPHMRRLYDSAKIYRMELPFPQGQLVEAVKETLRANELKSAYIRPVAFRSYGSLGVDPRPCPVSVAIATIEWGKYLGDDALENGVDVCVSSWNRPAPNTHPSLSKAGGNYLNSQLVKLEAIQNGYSEGIVLGVDGMLGEGSGENLFVIRDNVVYTPPVGASLLPGITRDSVVALFGQLGVEVRQQALPRELLYIADEIFFTGTAAEITPVRSVDGIVVGAGKRGPITAAVQGRFFDVINGDQPDAHGWLEFV
jgi:branched-chain amino acid aminotransferase